MIIEIRRNVQLFFRRCQMKIRKVDGENRREDLLAVLELAKDNEWRITPSMLNRELLGQDRQYPLGVGVLRNMADMGLVIRQGEDDRGDVYSVEYTMTEQGWNALLADRVKFTETGIYAVHMTDDQLLPEFLVDISLENERTDERDFQRNFDGLNKGAKRSLEEVPEQLLAMVGQNDILPLLRAGEGFDMLTVERFCARAKPQFTMELVIKSDEDNISMHLEANGQKVSLDPSRVTYDPDELFRALMRASGQTPMNGQRVIVDSYERTKPAERIGLSRRVTAESVQIRGLGVFENIDLQVPLYPDSLDSAVRWANDLIKEGLEQYMDRSDFLRIKGNVLERFSSVFDVPTLAKRTVDWDEMREDAKRNKMSDRVTYWKFWITDLMSAGGSP